MVSVPRGVVKFWPGPENVAPLIVSEAMPSGELNTIVPLVVSVLAAAFDPAGSPLRAGRPLSATLAVASVVATGWLTVMIPMTGLRSIGWGMTSRLGVAARPNSVGGSRSPIRCAAWIAPASSKKLLPELVGRPAAGWIGASPINSAARLSGGTATPSITIWGT